jgi:hypothetical protein
LLSEGKSPKKGLLIDFLGNFARSAEAGLPIFRIAGGSGVLWAGSFDQKGRGTVRVATVDASALQPGQLAAQTSTPPEPSVPEPSAPQSSSAPSGAPQLAARQPVDDRPPQGPPPASQAPANDNPPPSPTPDPPPPIAREAKAVPAGDAEAVIARLQAELSAAVRAKIETDQALSDAEKAAEAARAEADIAVRELEEARNDANAAKEQIEELIRTRGKSVSYAREMIVVGIFVVIGILLFLIRVISRMAAASAAVDEDASADLDAQLLESGPEGAAVGLPVSGSTEAEAHVDPDDVVKRLAQSLGVKEQAQESVQESVPLSPGASAVADGGHPAIEPQHQIATKADGGEPAAPSTAPPDNGLALPAAAEVKKLDPAEASHQPVPLKTAT